MRLNVSTLALISLGLLLAASPAMAGYTLQWEAAEDGALQMWWTDNGAPVAGSFVDTPLAAGQTAGGMAPSDAINGVHEQWQRSSNGVGCETHVTCGYPQPTPTFAESLAPYGDTISWLSLGADVDVIFDIDIPTWAAFVSANPMPDSAQTFWFDSEGYCPQLPGYYAMDGMTGATYEGPAVVVGTATLTVPEPVTMLMLGVGVVTLVRRRR